MSKLDIRDNSSTEVEAIVFADAGATDGWPAAQITKGYEGGIYLHDRAEDSTNKILTSDIPNLIKALEKAYELWG